MCRIRILLHTMGGVLVKELIDAFRTSFPDRTLIIKDLLLKLLDEVEFGMSNFKDDGFLLDELDSIHEVLDGLIEKIDVGFGQMNFLDGIQTTSSSRRPKHKELQVDNSIPHSLLENFTHIRPFGFTYRDGNLIETNTWKNLYIEICKMLFDMDKKTFMSFKDKTSMNGETRDYFSDSGENMDLPYFLRESIYINTRFDANGFRDLLIKAIKSYNLDVEDFKIYFKADYNSLHR